eukprot:12569154-Alexandrium_andersonii.AAC.1
MEGGPRHLTSACRPRARCRGPRPEPRMAPRPRRDMTLVDLSVSAHRPSVGEPRPTTKPLVDEQPRELEGNVGPLG